VCWLYSSTIKLHAAPWKNIDVYVAVTEQADNLQKAERSTSSCVCLLQLELTSAGGLV
jgi:hypothetical protein